MKINLLLLNIIFLSLISCSPEKEEINYGVDKCDFCDMTIVDKRFGSELVNNHGKAFKFDAIECMLRYLSDEKNNSKDFKLFYVTYYNAPGKLVDAQQSYYLISKQIPSPMGGFLSAYQSKEIAEEFKNNYGGDIFNWEEIKRKYERK